MEKFFIFENILKLVSFKTYSPNDIWCKHCLFLLQNHSKIQTNCMGKWKFFTVGLPNVAYRNFCFIFKIVFLLSIENTDAINDWNKWCFYYYYYFRKLFLVLSKSTDAINDWNKGCFKIYEEYYYNNVF